MIAVVDSGGANIASVMFALERLGVKARLTSDAGAIQSAERVILPGVGTAKVAMRQLQELELVDCVRSLTQPILGICLGMQLLFSGSEEGDVDMLDIIAGTVTHFTPEAEKTIPHMGWNSVSMKADHPLLRDVPNDSYFYFVHSYYAPQGNFTIGACDYGDAFSAIVAKDNFMGCQFHPERSGKAGAQILKNFVELEL